MELLHHHHKMVGFTLGILQRHQTYGYIGKSQWRIQDFLHGTSEGCLEVPQWVQRFAPGSCRNIQYFHVYGVLK